MILRPLAVALLFATAAFAQSVQTITRPGMPSDALFPYLLSSGFFFDDFSRADAQGAGNPAYGASSIGSAATGQPWSISGNGYQDVAIRDHRLVNLGTGTIYAVAKSPVTNFRAAGNFSLDPTYGTDDAWATIAATADPPYSSGFTTLLHFVVLQSGSWILTTRQNMGDFIPVAQGPLKAPLSPYVTYSMAMTVSGTNIYLELPDGTLAMTSTALVPLLTGSEVFWEMVNTPTNYRVRWEQVSIVPLPQGAPPPSLNFTGLSSSSAAVGSSVYCPDCAENTKPCAGGGTGTIALRVNTAAPVWKCQ
jgi:hypothetical protein